VIKILIVFYSRDGSTAALAKHIARGAANIDEVEVLLRTVPPVSTVCEATCDTIPDNGPPYATQDELAACDGLIIGSPTRFGNMAAPLKYFLDNTSNLWLQGALSGKPAAVFTSSQSLHGGQESTLLSMMIPLLHHGMIIVGLPFTESALVHTQSGGTPYGASHVVGDPKNPEDKTKLTEDEKQLAHVLGKRVADIAKRLKKSPL
jgi:NAD(P)H dehydrogenase (quinone)